MEDGDWHEEHCHPERSEGAIASFRLLRFAQDDTFLSALVLPAFRLRPASRGSIPPSYFPLSTCSSTSHRFIPANFWCILVIGAGS